MISFKTLTRSIQDTLAIQESLNKAQQRKMNSHLGIDPETPHEEVMPSPRSMEIHGHIFNQGHLHTIIPMHTETMDQVRESLAKHGHQMTDDNYRDGLFTDKHGRPVSIFRHLGRLANDKKSTEEERQYHKNLMDRYSSADRNAEIEADKHVIIGTIHPHQVAEMSTNKYCDKTKAGWRSCAGLNSRGNPTEYLGGVAAKRMPHELREGTMAFYKVKKDHIMKELKKHKMSYDEFVAGGHTAENKVKVKKIVQKAIDKSEGRTLAKPWKHNENDHGVVHPEGRWYGKSGVTDHNSLKVVSEWIKKHYPLDNGLYNKNTGVYDDSQGAGPRVLFNSHPDNIKKLMDHPDGSIRREVATNPNLDHATYHTLIDHTLDVIQHPENHIVIDPQYKENEKAIETMKEYKLLDGNSNIHHLAKNAGLSPDHIDKLLEKGGRSAYYGLTQQSKLSRRHIDAMLKHPEFGKEHNFLNELLIGQANTGNLTADHLHHILDFTNKNPDNYHSPTILKNSVLHKNFNSSHIPKLLQSNNRDVVAKLLSKHAESLTDEQLNDITKRFKLKDDGFTRVHQDAKSELMRRMKRRIDNDPNVSSGELHKTASETLRSMNHLDEDRHSFVYQVMHTRILQSIAKHPNVSVTTLKNMYLKSPDPELYKNVLENKKLKKSHLLDMVAKLKDPNDERRYLLAHNPNMTKQDLHDELDKHPKNALVANAVVNNPNHDESHLDKMIDNGFNRFAASSPHLNDEHVVHLIKRPEAFAALAQNQHVGHMVFHDLYRDGYGQPNHRELLARNPGIGKKNLESIRDFDEDESIRADARNTLEQHYNQQGTSS